jgi:DNA-binding transcriptional ArsR family regulator
VPDDAEKKVPTPAPADAPEIRWDAGTAYDFFASLMVLHAPGEYGLRASWAAGIRSRLSPSSREFFAGLTRISAIPIPWLYDLPAPKTARAVLDIVEALDPAAILPTLTENNRMHDAGDEIFRRITARGSWTPADLEELLATDQTGDARSKAKAPGVMEWFFDAWARPAEFGVSLRSGLREYYEVFYREEERRIAGDVERGLAHARELASRLPAAELFDELSQGIRTADLLARPVLILVPCYWCSPRIVYTKLSPDEELVLFGCRPHDASLIPGDTVPARLLLALEALSDPTRLSILRTMIAEPLTQADIARRLRLRPPTISHHLKSLRIAGLVAYIGAPGGETRYGARIQQVEETCRALKDFLRT